MEWELLDLFEETYLYIFLNSVKIVLSRKKSKK